MRKNLYITLLIMMIPVIIMIDLLHAQEENTFIDLAKYGRMRVPKALLNLISVNLEEVPFETALKVIAGKGNFQLNYNRSRLPIEQKVTVIMENVHALEALIKILKDTKTGLVITVEGQLAVVVSDEVIINKRATRSLIPRGTVKGKVTDADTKVPLEGVNVVILNTIMGAATDNEGNFTIPLIPVGNYSIQFSYVGYEPLIKTDIIVRSKRITHVQAELKISTFSLDTVFVKGGYFTSIKDQPVSAINFSMEEIRRAPSFLGDVNRVMRGLPGISKVNDTINGLNVRGGSPSENIVLIDNIEFPNINHFPIEGTSGGLLSFFNIDFIRNINFYTGGFSAAYGDKLSSVMDISFREGNRDEFDIQLDVNFAGIGGTVEGPIQNGKGSWLFSARQSFIEFLFKTMKKEKEVPEYNDFQWKVVYDFSPRHRISLLNIYGASTIARQRDDAQLTGENKYGTMGFRQNISGLNWRYLWGDKGYSNTSVSHSYVKNDWNWKISSSEKDHIRNHSKEGEIRFRNLNYYRFNENQKLEFGVEFKFIRSIYNNFYAVSSNSFGDLLPELEIDKIFQTSKYSAFVNYRWNIADKFNFSPGIRYDYFGYNKSRHVSPRISLSYKINRKSSVNAAAGVYYQTLPVILLVQHDTNKLLRDPAAHHFILGFDYLLADDTRFTIEAYYKKYNHFPLDPSQPSFFIIDQSVGELFFRNYRLLTDTGKAKSLGIELMIQKKLSQRFYGLLSGTFFRSRYLDFDGTWRNRIYDNRIMGSVEGGYKPNRKWEFSLRWIFAGGIPYTPYDIPFSKLFNRGVHDRNNFNEERLPAYHSLNVRFDRRFNFSNSNLISYLSIWNTYNKENIWYYGWSELYNDQYVVKQFERMLVFGLEFEF